MERISKSQLKLVRSLQLKKFRDETGWFVAEGEKCVEELRRGFELVYYIRTTVDDRVQTNLLLATSTEIEQMSGLRTPQGIIGVFKKRPAPQISSSFKAGLILALDGIQDPGNLGTIIRTCDWFGVHDIICSHDTADCYNPKVVQATMGALARVKVHYVEDLSLTLSSIEGAKIYGTLLDGKNMYEELSNLEELPNSQTGRSAKLSHNAIIVMGNEGKGISSEIRKIITYPLYIPSYTDNGQIKETSDVVESLNVSIATSIVLAEFRRR